MRQYLKWSSFLILAIMVAGAFLCSAGRLSADANRSLILVGTVGWFAIAPIWMQKH